MRHVLTAFVLAIALTSGAQMMMLGRQAHTRHVSLSRLRAAIVQWDPVAGVDGYRVYWGTRSSDYTQTADAGTNTQLIVSNLSPALTYFFAATSYAAGVESNFSAEVALTP